MARIVDLYCRCGRRENDVMAGVDETFECVDCHAPMEQDWLPRTRRPAQWDDNTAVMVHVDPKTGDVKVFNAFPPGSVQYKGPNRVFYFGIDENFATAESSLSARRLG